MQYAGIIRFLCTTLAFDVSKICVCDQGAPYMRCRVGREKWRNFVDITGSVHESWGWGAPLQNPFPATSRGKFEYFRAFSTVKVTRYTRTYWRMMETLLLSYICTCVGKYSEYRERRGWNCRHISRIRMPISAYIVFFSTRSVKAKPLNLWRGYWFLNFINFYI